VLGQFPSLLIPIPHFPVPRFLVRSTCSFGHSLIKSDLIRKLKEAAMRRLQPKIVTIERPRRVKLSEKEVIRRIKEFPKREAKFRATIRKGKDRSLPSRLTWSDV
jgi:hypothetical protein